MEEEGLKTKDKPDQTHDDRMTTTDKMNVSEKQEEVEEEEQKERVVYADGGGEGGEGVEMVMGEGDMELEDDVGGEEEETEREGGEAVTTVKGTLSFTVSF